PAAPVLPPGPPARPQSHRMLVAAVAAATAFVLTAVLAGLVAVAARSQHRADAQADRQQRFVDTATQMVVNMFSYDQDHIDDSIDRWIHDLSGPLRDQFSQPGTVDMLKGLFVDTKADSEAVINAAALEGIDEDTDRASVLVAARVTATDVNDGVNQPSQPYRLRVIVQEDSTGAMTAYDLLWPNGGA
ncbi:mammalian cell entry protein, partial [Mycolicibacillus trivialis]